VIEQVPARIDRGDVLVPGLGVHRHHQVDAAAPAQPAATGNAHLIPGGQALNVGGEDVAGRNRHAHPQDGTGEHLVGRRRAGTVDVGEFHDEVVGGTHLRHAYSVL